MSRSMRRPWRAGLADCARGSLAACLKVHTANSIPECFSFNVPRASNTHAKIACKMHILHEMFQASRWRQLLPLPLFSRILPFSGIAKLVVLHNLEKKSAQGPLWSGRNLKIVWEAICCHKAPLQQAHEPGTHGRRRWLQLSFWRQLSTLLLRAMEQ